MQSVVQQFQRQEALFNNENKKRKQSLMQLRARRNKVLKQKSSQMNQLQLISSHSIKRSDMNISQNRDYDKVSTGPGCASNISQRSNSRSNNQASRKDIYQNFCEQQYQNTHGNMVNDNSSRQFTGSQLRNPAVSNRNSQQTQFNYQKTGGNNMNMSSCFEQMNQGELYIRQSLENNMHQTADKRMLGSMLKFQKIHQNELLMMAGGGQNRDSNSSTQQTNDKGIIIKPIKSSGDGEILLSQQPQSIFGSFGATPTFIQTDSFNLSNDGKPPLFLVDKVSQEHFRKFAGTAINQKKHNTSNLITLNSNTSYSYEEGKQTRITQLTKTVQKELVDSRFTNDMLNPKRNSHIALNDQKKVDGKFTTSPQKSKRDQKCYTPAKNSDTALNRLRNAQIPQEAMAQVAMSAQKTKIEKLSPFKQSRTNMKQQQSSQLSPSQVAKKGNVMQEQGRSPYLEQHPLSFVNMSTSNKAQDAPFYYFNKGPTLNINQVDENHQNHQGIQIGQNSHTQKRPSPVNFQKEFQQSFNINPKKMRVLKAHERATENHSREDSQNGDDKKSNDYQRTSQSANYPLKNENDFVYNYLMKSNCKSPPQVVSPFQSLSSENQKNNQFTMMNNQSEKSPYNDFINHSQSQHKQWMQMKQVQKMKSETSLTSMDLKSEIKKDPVPTNNAITFAETNPNSYDVIRAAHNNSINSVESIRNEEQRRIDAQRHAKYTKTKNGDIIVYDSRCRIQTFKEEDSLKVVDMMQYFDLDQESLRSSIEGQQIYNQDNQSKIHACCNELPWRNKDGSTCATPYNDVLLMLYSPFKNLYDAQQGSADQERLRQIKFVYKKFKNVQDYMTTLIIPRNKQGKSSFKFYSRFESGNLLKVIKVPVKPDLSFSGIVQAREFPIKYEYDLYLDQDTTTDGHMHWYFFQTISKNMPPGTRIRMNIRNLVRSKSLYQEGMLPRICFDKPLQNAKDGNKKGWHHNPNVTQEVRFHPTDQAASFDNEFINKDRQYSTLSFIYVVQEENESVFFSYDPPYTFSKNLKSYIDSLRYNSKYASILRIQTLCRSLAGNECKFFTISENVANIMSYQEMLQMHLYMESRDRIFIKEDYKKLSEEQILQKVKEIEKERRAQTKDKGINSRYHDYLFLNHHKRAIIITSRVHPGETQASFSLEGIVNYILGDSEEAKELRQKYIIYVIPMLNIDGVVHGNQRTNLAGFDLNRKWSDPSPYLSPVIYATKLFSKMIQDEREIDIYADLHGHYQPCGTFMYCNSFDRGTGVPPIKYASNASLRVIPYLLTQENKHFQIRDTFFNMEQYKASSARQVFFTEFKVLNSFTLENSFFKKYTEREIQILQNLQLTTSQKDLQINSLSKMEEKRGEGNKNNNNAANNKIQKTLSQLSTHSRNGENDSVEKNKDNKFRSVSRAESKRGEITPVLGSEQNNDNINTVDNTTKEGTSDHTVTLMSRVPSSLMLTPGQVFDQTNYTYHFTADDHIELGRDLAIVICKVILKTPENVEKVNQVQQRFLQYLHGRHLQVNINTKKINLNTQAGLSSPSNPYSASSKQLESAFSPSKKKTDSKTGLLNQVIGSAAPNKAKGKDLLSLSPVLNQNSRTGQNMAQGNNSNMNNNNNITGNNSQGNNSPNKINRKFKSQIR